MSENEDHERIEIELAQPDQWWLACPEPLLVWARLRVLASGVAQVLDSQGQTLTYESEDMARSALLDADFRAFDGLDEDDAEAWGLFLDELAPPEGEDDDDLVPQMIRTLGPRH